MWLASGSYTVVINAATQDGSALGAMSVALAARTLSDPIDPYVTDPTSPPPVQDPITVTVPVTTPPPDPIVDPIINPFAGLFGGL